MCNQNYGGLVVSGEPTQDEILNNWNDIYSEYCELQNNDDSEYLFTLSKKISLLQADIAYVDYTLTFLQKIAWADEVAKELSRLGFKVDQNNLDTSVDFCRSKLKRKIFDLENLHDEYTRYVASKDKGGKAPNEDEFRKNVVLLSKYQGYRIDTAKSSVYEFVMIQNNYIAEYAERKKQLDKNG